jgi:hypothetical protein
MHVSVSPDASVCISRCMCLYLQMHVAVSPDARVCISRCMCLYLQMHVAVSPYARVCISRCTCLYLQMHVSVSPYAHSHVERIGTTLSDPPFFSVKGWPPQAHSLANPSRPSVPHSPLSSPDDQRSSKRAPWRITLGPNILVHFQITATPFGARFWHILPSRSWRSSKMLILVRRWVITIQKKEGILGRRGGVH